MCTDDDGAVQSSSSSAVDAPGSGARSADADENLTAGLSAFFEDAFDFVDSNISSSESDCAAAWEAFDVATEVFAAATTRGALDSTWTPLADCLFEGGEALEGTADFRMG